MAMPDDTPGEDSASAPASSDAVIAALQAEIVQLRAENAALLGRLADLERRLGLNSRNSGKPPSSDGLKKPSRVSSLREPTGKTSGGQTGHPGKTLRRTETPDATINHYPKACAACGEPLTEAMAIDHVARQVFDLPEPKPLIVTEHRAHGCCCAMRCANAGSVSRGGERTGAIRSADWCLCAVSAALPVAAREASGHADGRSVRRDAGGGDHCTDQPRLRHALPGLHRCRARPGRGGGGQAPG